MRNRAAERAAAEFARGYAGLYHPYAFPWPAAAAAAHLWPGHMGGGGGGGGQGGGGTGATGGAGATLPLHHHHHPALAGLSAATAGGGVLPLPTSSDLSHPGSHSTSSTRPSSSESPTIREKHGNDNVFKIPV